MTRPNTLEELENVYDQMKLKWLNSPEKWCIDPKLSINDKRTCFAIYSLDKCKIYQYTWNRLIKWLKSFINYGIIYNNYPSSIQGLLHFTFHQLGKFDQNNKTINLDYNKTQILYNFLRMLSGLKIIFRGLLLTPTGIALKGYPSDEIQLKKLMGARNELDKIMKLLNIDYEPPYINDICHITLFRWTTQPNEEIIKNIQNTINIWNEAVFAELTPKSWCIGAGTYMMQEPFRKDFNIFYCPTFIAHRGLTAGPDKNKENNLSTLKERCLKGLISECDVWLLNDKLFLGHDIPIEEIQFEDINSPYLFLHAKNKDAYEYLLNKCNYEGYLLNIFWHTTEDYVLTNHGDIIVYPGKDLIQNSIFMMPEKSNDIKNNNICKFICSDFLKHT